MSQYSKKWFTFIEITLAILVFSIGILAVLSVMTNNLSLVKYAQLKTQGSLLAQEWLSLVFNMRDANRDLGISWDCIRRNSVFTSDTVTDDDICADRFQTLAWSWLLMLVWFAQTGYYYVDLVDSDTSFDTLFDNTNLIYSSWSVFPYVYDGSEDSFFARYILFTGVYDSGTMLPLDTILRVQSHVLYRIWDRTWDIVLESFIADY